MITTYTGTNLGLAHDTTEDSAVRRWTGRVLIGLPMALFGFDGLMKLLAIPEVVEGSAKMGFGRETLPLIGAVELLAVLLFLSRRTWIVGAVLASAYLGGAVCTHIRAGQLPQALAPVAFAAVIWGGLYIRDARVRALSPFANHARH